MTFQPALTHANDYHLGVTHKSTSARRTSQHREAEVGKFTPILSTAGVAMILVPPPIGGRARLIDHRAPVAQYCAVRAARGRLGFTLSRRRHGTFSALRSLAADARGAGVYTRSPAARARIPATRVARARPGARRSRPRVWGIAHGRVHVEPSSRAFDHSPRARPRRERARLTCP